MPEDESVCVAQSRSGNKPGGMHLMTWFAYVTKNFPELESASLQPIADNICALHVISEAAKGKMPINMQVHIL